MHTGTRRSWEALEGTVDPLGQRGNGCSERSQKQQPPRASTRATSFGQGSSCQLLRPLQPASHAECGRKREYVIYMHTILIIMVIKETYVIWLYGVMDVLNCHVCTQKAYHVLNSHYQPRLFQIKHSI